MKVNNSNNEHAKFNFKDFGNGKNAENKENDEKLFPCKVFLGRKGKAVLIPKEKKNK